MMEYNGRVAPRNTCVKWGCVFRKGRYVTATSPSRANQSSRTALDSTRALSSRKAPCSPSNAYCLRLLTAVYYIYLKIYYYENAIRLKEYVKSFDMEIISSSMFVCATSWLSAARMFNLFIFPIGNCFFFWNEIWISNNIFNARFHLNRCISEIVGRIRNLFSVLKREKIIL